ncbi:hypothetical protein V865_003400 [Kwoniella europaea PYCC6329]|uniref:DUF427 domain-containing protein n=1 Tax=Kwoniella europaea PYCC6329 TaxID=1423913 RepID=A0AAX4KFP3_9TREE
MTSNQSVPLAPRKAEEDVWKYPRPPALQRTPNRLRVIWTSSEGTETIIADSTEGYRVLETSHPPTYYLPPSAVKVPLTKTTRQTFCEWKGKASYHTFNPPSSSKEIENRICFYASTGKSEAEIGGRWRCFVDEEEVGVQQGDFYGGWITSNIKGKMKGGPGTWGW